MQNTSTLLGLPMLYVKTTENSCSKQHALKWILDPYLTSLVYFFLSFNWLVSNDVIFINMNNLFVCFSALWQNPENVLETTCTEKSSERRRRNAFISGIASLDRETFISFSSLKELTIDADKCGRQFLFTVCCNNCLYLKTTIKEL